MSAAHTPVDLAALLAAVRSFADSHYPGQLPRMVTITFRGDLDPVTVPVPPPVVVADADRPEPQQRVIALFDAAGEGQVYTARQIAVECGYEPDSGYLRGHLATLTRLGVLVNGNRGYKRGPQFVTG